jgi:hypothetical protein
MKSKFITYVLAIVAAVSVGNAFSAEKGKAKAEEKAPESKAEPKAKRDTYPLYGKVVAITSRTLTIVRSNAADAKEAKYTINSATEIVNGDKAATAEDVKVGKWVGGLLKKAEGDGNDVVVKLNIAAKQKEDTAPKGKGDAKGSKKEGSK